MIKKQLLLIFILLSFFCFTNISAQTQKGKQPLIEILEELHLRFECNFSYIDNDIKYIFLEPPSVDLNLKQSIDYLQTKTPLQFTILGNNFITITNKDNSFSICGYIVDIATNEVVPGCVIQSKSSSTISDDKGYFRAR